MSTILEAAKWIPFSKYHDSEDLFQVYVTKFNGNPEGFLYSLSQSLHYLSAILFRFSQDFL